ncbi:MAG: ATP-dependent DNA helicase RecG [Planctomycetes bacterium]|nr:ATP-dependent DNA helicase RecG [Planctomycetota bacterium]
MSSDVLSKPIMYVKGVGPRRAEAFESLGVRTVGDLLEHLPSRYELLPKSIPIGDLAIDETATVVGSVGRVRSSSGFRRASVVADVVDGTGTCRVRWFNAPYIRDQVFEGCTIRLTGRVADGEQRAEFINPAFRLIPEDADPLADDVNVLIPVYPATQLLPPKQISRVVSGVLVDAVAAVQECLPPDILQRRGLLPRAVALKEVHRPTSTSSASSARNRLAYDELLLMQLAIRMRRARAKLANNAPQIVTTPKIDERIRARLPFNLTQAQNNAVTQIARDLRQTRPMARLLQGDVGCGKTAVAIYAALTCVANRRQVTILAPTEILARQTHDGICTYLQGSRVKTGLLVGQAKTRERRATLADFASGKIDIAVGTHALLEDDVRWSNLGLVIVDEQHRFGVAQRTALRCKARGHHYLVMTATPIPRTLAMTVYGDLDVTTIDELPAGRQPVETKIVGPRGQAKAWLQVRSKLAAGEKAFVVYPLVEESENFDLKDATAQLESLRTGELRGFEIDLLHGRMKSDEKLKVMNAFRSGSVQALVCTTVIEVGVDIPEATVLVVEHADRYGLAQLHQLRGRVGRGNKPATSFLFSDSNAKKARTRLDILRSTTDGFKIAEADLQLRGPGEIVGTRQHGLPMLKAADLTKDFNLLRWAIEDADSLLHDDPNLQKPIHNRLAKSIQQTHSLAIQ